MAKESGDVKENYAFNEELRRFAVSLVKNVLISCGVENHPLASRFTEETLFTKTYAITFLLNMCTIIDYYQIKGGPSTVIRPHFIHPDYLDTIFFGKDVEYIFKRIGLADGDDGYSYSKEYMRYACRRLAAEWVINRYLSADNPSPSILTNLSACVYGMGDMDIDREKMFIAYTKITENDKPRVREILFKLISTIRRFYKKPALYPMTRLELELGIYLINSTPEWKLDIHILINGILKGLRLLIIEVPNPTKKIENFESMIRIYNKEMLANNSKLKYVRLSQSDQQE